jgi:molybdopterin converting factor small subunit
MRVSVQFYSSFKDLAGCAQTTETLPEGSSVADLLRRLDQRFPGLAGMENSMMIAVGVDYQRRYYPLKEGDEVSLFPPVQGG